MLFGASRQELPFEDVGILLSRELLASGHLHHVSKKLDAVAVGVVEIERAAAAAAEQGARPVAAFGAVDQWTLLDLDALLAQVVKCLQPFVAAVHLERDVLQRVVASIAVLGGHFGRVCEEHDIVVLLVEPHEGHLAAARRPAARQCEPEDVPVPGQRAVHVGNMDADVPDAADGEALAHGALSLLAIVYSLRCSPRPSITGFMPAWMVSNSLRKSCPVA